MKKLLIFFIALILGLQGLGGSAAHGATDTRYFQYISDGPDSSKTLANTAFDIREGQFGITSDGEFQFFLVTESSPEEGAEGTYAVTLDTDLDGEEDYWISVSGEDLSSYTRSVVVLDYQTNEDASCTASAWITPDADAVGFSLERGCMALLPTMGIRFYAAQGAEDYDFAPSNPVVVKASYLSGQTCTPAKNGKKFTYLGKTYICQKTGGKWVNKDYGAILALKAKYITDKVYYSCLFGKVGAKLSDGNKTLVISGAGKYSITLSDFDCVKRVAKFPTWLNEQIGMTRALDGMQKATYSSYTVTWNYHPDDGVNMTLRKSK